MRLLFPLILCSLAIAWMLYSGLIRKDWKKAKDILMPTLFFGIIWAAIYILLFK